MKRYFWSGNSNTVNGTSKQTWGIWDAPDDADPFQVATQICETMKEKTEAETFCLVAFNLVS